MAENKWVARVNPFVTISSKPTNPVPVDHVTTGKARLLRKVKASLSSAFTWRPTKIKGFEGKVESEQYVYTVYSPWIQPPCQMMIGVYNHLRNERYLGSTIILRRSLGINYIWYTSPKTKQVEMMGTWQRLDSCLKYGKFLGIYVRFLGCNP